MRKQFKAPSPKHTGRCMKAADIISTIIVVSAYIFKYVVIPIAAFVLSDNGWLLGATIIFEIVYDLYKGKKKD